jgi:hypothetical protein
MRLRYVRIRLRRIAVEPWSSFVGEALPLRAVK